MEWPLSFLIVPLVLDRSSRESLPRTTATHLATWVDRNPIIRAELPGRAVALTPRVLESLRFGAREGMLAFEDGFLYGRVTGVARDAALVPLVSSAALLGRWFCKAQSTSTVFALFGVGL